MEFEGFWKDLGISPPSTPSALPGGPAGTGDWVAGFWKDLGGPSRTTAQGAPGEIPLPEPPPESPDNPFAYTFGLVKNMVGDVPEMLKGLWTIGSATGEDAWGAITKYLIPGEQSAEKKVEEQGYNWGHIVRSADEMVFNDYASRYGMHGLEEMKDQLYANPLTYLLDFLGAGSALSKGAYAGSKLGLVSDDLATKIRGISPMAEPVAGALRAMPSTPVANLTGSAITNPMTGGGVRTFGSLVTQPETGVMSITTSFNPAKRIIQNTFINRLLTRNSDKVLDMMGSDEWARLVGTSGDNPSLRGSAKNVAEMAKERELRVLKYQPQRFVSVRAARVVAGIFKQQFYASRNPAIMELRQILELEDGKGEPDWDLVQRVMGTDEFFQAKLNGTDLTMEPRPVRGPVAVPMQGIPYLDDLTAPLVSATNAEARIAFHETLRRHFMDATGTAQTSFTTPFSKHVEAGSEAMRGTGLIGSMDQAPGEAMRLADENGWQLLGVRDTMMDPSSWWNGHAYVYDTGNGIAEVNLATEELYNAQKIVSELADHVEHYGGLHESLALEQVSLLRELDTTDISRKELLSPEDRAKVEQLENLEQQLPHIRDELEATSYIQSRVWDYPMRYTNAKGRYAPDVEMVDRLFNWTVSNNYLHFKNSWDPDWAAKGIAGPMGVSMNRAFMPIKMEVLHKIMGDIKNDIAAKILNGKQKGEDFGSIVDTVAEYLRGFYMIPEDAIWDALYTPHAGAVEGALKDYVFRGKAIQNPDAKEILHEASMGLPAVKEAKKFSMEDPEVAAKLVADRLLNTMRMPVLKGHAIGKNKVWGEVLEAWNWKTFADLTPDLPGYYPHLRSGQPGGLWFKGQAMKAPQMEFAKGFKNYLAETGRLEDRPYVAFSKRAYQLLRHEELIDQLSLLERQGRKLLQGELAKIDGGIPLEGEVLVSTQYLRNQYSLHAELLDDIWQGVDDEGLLYEDAARKAMEGLNQRLQESTLKDIAEAEVYAVPRYVADQFHSAYIAGFSPARMRFFWDKPKDLWISSVLGLNPRWFIYRTMGNIVGAGIANPMAIPRMLSYLRKKNNGIIEEMFKSVEFPDGSTALDHMGRGYAAAESQRLGFLPGSKKVRGLPAGTGDKLRDWGSSADELPGATRLADRIYKSRLAFLPKKISRGMTNIVNIMEQAERRGVALSVYGKAVGRKFDSNISLARRMAKEGVDQNLMDEMVNQANWTLGDYTNLSPVERDIVRRFLIPFYPFYRHMLKFAIRMPWDHHFKAQVLNYLHQIDEEMGPDLPDWLGSAIYIGEIGGMPNYWNITHYNPLSELSMPESNPLNFIDPRLKVLLQAFTGIDEFNRPFRSENVYNAPNGVKLIRTSSGWEVFEGIQHPHWKDMLMGLYGGPGAQLINPYGYNQPWHKVALAQLGVGVVPYDQTAANLRNLEAVQAALSSSAAREVPYTFE